MRNISYLTQVATLKLKRDLKPLFAANYTDFREFEKNSVQISEICGKVFDIPAWWQLGLFIKTCQPVN
jgi:hypothetical protein